MLIQMNSNDLHILRLSHGPNKVHNGIIDRGALTVDDCKSIWPHAFRGNMNVVVSVLREAGYRSAQIARP